MTDTVYTLAGAFGSPTQIPPMLGGTVTNGRNVVPVNYPNWTIFEAQVEQGAQILNTTLLAGSGTMIVMGHSLGAVVASNWLNNYGPSSTIDPSDLSFVLMGNSMRPYGGICYQINWYPGSTAPANTPYSVTDIVRQYDGWADWPNGFGDLWGDANGLAGQNNVHPFYTGITIDDPNNVSYQTGNINYIWSPTWPVPILGTAQNSGIAAMDADIRPTIEQAYDRPVSIPDPTYQ